MAEFDLNLSTRPFPAYRLLNLALVVVLALLAVISIWQTYGFFHYSALTSSIRADEQSARVEAEALGRHVADLESRLDRPEATAKLNEIGFINRLIMRKGLSWTRMFADLEDMVPENVQLLSVKPDIAQDGSIILNMNVRGRSVADMTQLLDALEQSPVFENVKLALEEKHDASATSDVDFSLTANYYPQRGVK